MEAAGNSAGVVTAARVYVRQEMARLRAVIAEITAENLDLKKKI